MNHLLYYFVRSWTVIEVQTRHTAAVCSINFKPLVKENSTSLIFCTRHLNIIVLSFNLSTHHGHNSHCSALMCLNCFVCSRTIHSMLYFACRKKTRAIFRFKNETKMKTTSGRPCNWHGILTMVGCCMTYDVAISIWNNTDAERDDSLDCFGHIVYY